MARRTRMVPPDHDNFCGGFSCSQRRRLGSGVPLSLHDVEGCLPTGDAALQDTAEALEVHRGVGGRWVGTNRLAATPQLQNTGEGPSLAAMPAPPPLVRLKRCPVRRGSSGPGDLQEGQGQTGTSRAARARDRKWGSAMGHGLIPRGAIICVTCLLWVKHNSSVHGAAYKTQQNDQQGWAAAREGTQHLLGGRPSGGPVCVVGGACRMGTSRAVPAARRGHRRVTCRGPTIRGVT